MRQTRLLVLGVAMLLLAMSGCAGESQLAAKETTIATQPLEATHTVPVPTPTVVSRATSTSRPTKAPTDTPQPSPTPEAEGWPYEIARNHVGLYEQEGLTIEVSRVLFATKKTMQRLGMDADSEGGNWAIADVFVEFVLIIRNESGKTLSLYPDQGTVLIGSYQVEMGWETMNLLGYDSVGGDIYDGVVKVGGFWIPAPRLQLEDVETVVFRFDAAHDDSYENVGDDWIFEIDMSGRPWEPWDDSVVQP